MVGKTPLSFNFPQVGCYKPSPSRLFWILILAVCGYGGNALSFPVTFGTDFRFGGIASIITAIVMGWPAATLVAIISALATKDFGNQFGNLILAVGEAVFVALAYRRFWRNAIVATTIYWLIPGAIILAAIYGLENNLNVESFLLIWFTRCINSIFNSFIASVGLITVLTLRCPSTKVPVQEAFFNTLVAMIFLPILAIVVLVSHNQMQVIKQEIQKDTLVQATNIVQYLNLWKDHHLNAVRTMAEAAAETGIKRSERLQQALRLIHETHPSFHDVFVADTHAKTFGFHPPTTPRGESLIGLSFFDRQYFRDVSKEQKPLVSDVILGRGGIDFPIICFVAPIFTKDNSKPFAGFALGSVDVRDLARNIKLLISDPSFKITLSDRTGVVITSTDEMIASMAPISALRPDELPSTRLRSNSNLSLSSPMPAPVRVLQVNRYGRTLPIVSLGWKIHVDTSLDRYTQITTRSIIQIFGQMLILTVAGIGLSILVIKWVSRPIEKLAAITTDLSNKPTKALPLNWPHSHFLEVDTLIQNFSLMALSLQERFKELKNKINEHLVTEQKLQQAMTKASAANLAKSEFLATMSHEIRTPLGAIIGYADLLKWNRGAEEDKASWIEAILRNSKQLSELVNDILDLSKIEAGHLNIQPSWVSLDEILASGVEALSCRAQAKNLSLNIKGVGRFPTHVYVDPIRLNQILINIVGNAIKFTDHGTITVTLSLQVQDRNTNRAILRVLVEDTGIGISAEAQDRLFTPFMQADATYSRRFAGTGLGLALARKIAHALHGQLNLVQSIPGSGSSFEMIVEVGIDPKYEMFQDLAEARATVNKPVRPTEENRVLLGKKILLVDDAPDNRILISRVLSIYGALVTNVESGQEALAQCDKTLWDVVLMDMQMPVMDGFQTTQELRHRGYEQPIIALTAHAMAGEKAQCLEVGCNDHVAKPVNWNQLIAVIQKWTSGSPPDGVVK